MLVEFRKKTAISLPEVLVTILIICIVTTITFPGFYRYCQKVQYVTGLKKTHTEFQQLFKQYLTDNKAQDLSKTYIFNNKIDNKKQYKNLDDLMKKHFKVKKVCFIGDKSCAIKGTFLSGGFSVNEFSNNNYNFCVKDERCFSIKIDNKNCRPNYSIKSSMKGICGYISVDVNGPKPPNKMGRDYQSEFLIGPDGNLYPEPGSDYADYISSLYKDAKSSDLIWLNSPSYCGTLGTPKLPTGAVMGNCIPRIMYENWKMNY